MRNFEDKKNYNEEFETDKLIIKPLSEEHNSIIAEYFKNNHEEYENYYLEEYDDDCLRFIYEHPRTFMFGMFLKDSGEYVGYVSFNMKNSSTAFIAYYVFPKYRGNGYCVESLRALCKKALSRQLVYKDDRKGITTQVIRTIEFDIALVNQKSIHIATKLGARLNKSFKEDIPFKNKWLDTVIYILDIQNLIYR